MFRSFCILVATGAVLCSPLHAVRLGRHHETHHPRWQAEVVPHLGAVVFGGESRDILGLEGSTGGVFGIDLGFFVTDYLELGVGISDIPTSTILRRSGPYIFSPPLESIVGADILLTDFNLLYNLARPEERLVPFLQAGVGRESIFYDGTYDGGFTTYNLGLGVRALLHERVSLTPSFRHYRTFVGTGDGDLNLSQFRLGLSILF